MTYEGGSLANLKEKKKSEEYEFVGDKLSVVPEPVVVEENPETKIDEEKLQHLKSEISRQEIISDQLSDELASK